MSLLPVSSSEKERSLETVCAVQLDVNLRALWDAEDCPLYLLPYLAWAFSVDAWDDSWSEAVKREVVQQSMSVHQQKGTVGSIRRALIAMGYGDAIVETVQPYINYDGSSTYDGTETYHDGNVWAQYKVILTRSIPNDQSSLLRETLESIAPARCELVEIVYPAEIYNGDIDYDGTYNYGGA